MNYVGFYASNIYKKMKQIAQISRYDFVVTEITFKNTSTFEPPKNVRNDRKLTKL